MSVIIFGVGSHQGDDTIGWEVVGHLQRTHPRLRTHLIESGSALLDYCASGLDHADIWIFVDALDFMEQLGRVHRMTWPDDRLIPMRARDSHGLGIVDALRLAESLSLLPRRVILFGVEARGWQPSGGLDPALLACVPGVADVVLAEIETWERATDEHPIPGRA